MAVQLNIYAYGPASAMVDELLDTAVGYYIVPEDTFWMYDAAELMWTVTLADKTAKNNLVSYIYQWLPDRYRENVKFFDKPIKDVGTKNAYNSMMKDWK